MERHGRAETFGLLLLVCWLLLGPGLAQVRHPLPVLWMMPFSSGSGRENVTAAVAPAIRLALQDLQRQSQPLGNYEVQLQLLDSQCDAAKSLKALFDALWAGPKFLLLFGGVCPSVTTLIARSLPALNLVQVSFAPSSPSLSNRKWYGNLFSTMPSDRALNQAMVKLLQRFRWSRVGVITQEGPRLSEMKKDLMRQLLKAEVQVLSSESLSADVCSGLRRLKETDVRIIIGQFEEDSVSEVFCCAYRLNLFGPRYQWLVVDGGTVGWRLGWQVSGCMVDSLLMAADGAIRLQMRGLGSSSTAGISGRTPQEYQDSYLRELAQEGSKVSSLHSFAYDAMWLSAKALSQVMEAVKNRERYSLQRNVSVSPEEVHKMLLEAVKSTQFEGVTGPVFYRNGERMTSIELIQLQGSSGVSVGEFSTSTQQLRVTNNFLKFKGPAPVRDRTLVLDQWQHVSLLLYGIISSAAAVVIVITVTVLCFTCCSQKLRLLRWSGGPQDELLLLGILLSSSSVLVSGLDEALLSDQVYQILCSARLWTLCMGHSVGFAALFTQSWRVFSLCRSKRTPTRLQQTGFVVLWLFMLDVFVLVSWQILDPLKRGVLQQSLQSDQDVVVRLFSERCSSFNTDLWLTAVYGYKGPLLGLGCFVAWSIRSAQVDHPAISSKQLSLSVFAVTVFSVSGVSGSLLTSHNPPVQFCVINSLVLCCNIFTLSCMFGPKFVYVFYHSSELQQPSELQAAEEEEEEQLSRLNRQLKSQTQLLDVEIETITMQLCEDESADSDLKCQNTTTRGRNNGDARSVVSALICSEDTNSDKPLSPDDINSPEHVRRRLSIQLPILHHSYLPVIGGVSASSSSLFGSREAFVHHDLLTATS